jgi:hypothetical protein
LLITVFCAKELDEFYQRTEDPAGNSLCVVSSRWSGPTGTRTTVTTSSIVVRKVAVRLLLCPVYSLKLHAPDLKNTTGCMIGMKLLYPFVKPGVAIEANRLNGFESEDPGAVRFRGKTCHLCTDSRDGPAYDLWHVLFECTATCQRADMIAVRTSCIYVLSQ